VSHHNNNAITTKAVRNIKLHQNQNLISDLNPDFQINLNPDVCQIAPIM